MPRTHAHALAISVALATEFNDELTVILSEAEKLSGLALPHRDRTRLFEVIAAARRGSGIVSQVLEYAAQNGGRPGRTRIEQLLKSE